MNKLYEEIKQFAEVPAIKELLDCDFGSEVDRIYTIQAMLIVHLVDKPGKLFPKEVAYILSMAIILAYYIDEDLISKFYPDFFETETQERLAEIAIDLWGDKYPDCTKENILDAMQPCYVFWLYIMNIKYMSRGYYWSFVLYYGGLAKENPTLSVTDTLDNDTSLHDDIITIRNMIA